MAKSPEKKTATKKTAAKKTATKKTATKKTAAKKTATKNVPSKVSGKVSKYPEAKHLTHQSLDNFAAACLTNYGTSVVEDRAVAEFRDGLKPVHRAILWSMYELGLHKPNAKYKKSARVVGDTLGKYHPHGDSACYNAAVTLANTKIKAIDGQGNWGTPVDTAAAMRYTECRVSSYSSIFMLDSRYMKLVPMEDNFDGTEKIPRYLPALLPSLLVLGSARQPAFGVSVGTPSFEIEGVAKLVMKGLKGKEITTEDCIKYLEPTYSYGCENLTNEASYEQLMRIGRASLTVRPKIVPRYDKRVILINSYCPSFANVDSVSKKMNAIAGFDGVSQVSSGSQLDEECCVEVLVKRGVSEDAFFDLYEKIQKYMTAKDSYELGFIFRRSSTEITFHKTGFARYLNNWCVYRRKLEEDLIAWQLEDRKRELARLERLVFAVNNREVIIKALDNKDPDAFLVKKLKKPAEYVKLILDLQVRKLAKLELKDLNSAIKEVKVEIKQLKIDAKNSGKRAATETKKLVEKFKKLQ